MSSHRFAQLVAAATFLLLIAGALVTSTGSGLSVPDWPLSYGSLFPPMVGGIRFEHTHRLIAGTVALLTIALACWLWRREPQRATRHLGLVAVSAIVAQALLGGLTVLYQLPVPVSVAHACLGQTFFCLIVAIAVITSSTWQAATPTVGAAPCRLRTLALGVVSAIYLQLVLGAVRRHTGFGLSWHVAGAALAVVVIGWTAAHTWRHHRAERRLLRPALLLVVLLMAQLSLGIITAWVRASVVTRTAHVVTGALLLATSVVLALWAFRCTVSPQRRTSRIAAYLELTKPRLTMLAVATTAVGLYLGAHGVVRWPLFAATLLGAALVGGGAGALNQYLEREADALMRRTQGRPLPSGRLQPEAALAFGVGLSVAGLVWLAWRVNALSAALGAATLGTYLFCYTPLKRRTALCTLVGAIPGALPPLIGWSAARNTLDVGAWVLFAILFLWQLPHFLALAWLYRDDYARAGFRMLTVVDPSGESAARQIALYCLVLLPVALIPTLLGMAGTVYFFGALTLSLAFCACGLAMALLKTHVASRRLFLASITYLPLLLTLMSLDCTPALRSL